MSNHDLSPLRLQDLEKRKHLLFCIEIYSMKSKAPGEYSPTRLLSIGFSNKERAPKNLQNRQKQIISVHWLSFVMEVDIDGF